ncbi:MAG TPA: PorP/SprF family type IX secretion system membrane protein [Saprospiraceae bacterium]|nr:PorP/SprF family type IX secretion system membrane protein [Saprospiraceae bacterium]MCC6687874.1 PorP/SprF family type IX secretion system membrane protein [Saprospiraceae bacterium]HMV23964.1 PorP/SprF family type IX secretion system membrane protein [Saprospiraceae bacterium]HMX81900.1 PorP/SprF family type IX secretion system membrane protein [Saprospiraceae bacterium]HMX85099.1 PorP/SprF family type IX secretion system membrane protein [Saprospiraceae bacterium]
MRFLKLGTILICLFVGNILMAQDIHFTQYNMSPMTLNPALTGNYLGSYRVGGIYRNQWASIIPAYSTPSFFVDAPIITGFRKNDWIGVGVAITADKSGTAKLGRTAFMGSVAYHLGLNKKSTSVLTIGLQGGRQSQNVDLQSDKIKFIDELESPIPIQSADRNLGQGDKKGYLDINAGLTLKSKLNQQMDFIVGFAMGHINKPEYAFSGDKGSQNRLSHKYVGHGTFNVNLNPVWSISPSFLYQTIAGQNEMVLQGLAGYKLKNTKAKVQLNFGLGYRLRDAAEILIGMDYDNLKVGFSWDANTSGVSGKFNGGYEIAAMYTGMIYKKPKVNTVIFCPRF